MSSAGTARRSSLIEMTQLTLRLRLWIVKRNLRIRPSVDEENSQNWILDEYTSNSKKITSACPAVSSCSTTLSSWKNLLERSRFISSDMKELMLGFPPPNGLPTKSSNVRPTRRKQEHSPRRCFLKLHVLKKRLNIFLAASLTDALLRCPSRTCPGISVRAAGF